MRTGKIHFFAATGLLLFLLSITNAQTTAFNYQGRLTEGGSPANGSYQMQFKLFDALSGGNQIGGTISDVNLTVTNGIFGTKLDFGANALSGANRWLEIAVRHSSSEFYTLLAPREQIASSPYAVRTLSAASADNALNLGGIPASEYVTNSTVGSSFIRNGTTLQTGNFNISGNGFFGGGIGLGTSNLISPLTIQNTSFTYGWTQTNGTVSVSSYVDPTGGWLGTRSNHPLYFFTNGGLQQTALLPNGNFGIGTVLPSQLLHVNNSGGNAAALVQTPTNAFAQFQMKSGAANTWTIGTQDNFAGGGLLFRYDGSDFMNIRPNGSLTQPRDKSGMVKAMVYVNGDGVILRCYNGITGASTGNCGFNITKESSSRYFVDFNFQIDDRFLSVSVNNNNNVGIAPDAGVSFGISSPNDTAFIYTYQVGSGPSDRPFMLIVY